MVYIQRKDSQTGQLETVDECETRKEANTLRKEYVMADPYASYYLSSRACKAWRSDNDSD
jgi:hypothetical protein